MVNKNLNLEYDSDGVHHVEELGMNVHGTLPQVFLDKDQSNKSSLHLYTILQSGTAEIERTPLATLAAGGAIKNYDAAQTDENYVRNTDGAQKWRKMNKDLQKS